MEKEAFLELPWEMVVRSFKKCCIFNLKYECHFKEDGDDADIDDIFPHVPL